MYKLLLCWRYLRTRYIALVCIVSVTLGVATMIVVNSVMEGFSHEMNSRLNGMLGDLVLESRSMDGAADAEAHMRKMREVAGEAIAGMSPTVNVPALCYLDIGGELLTRQLTVVGIDEATYSSVSKFGTYLQHPENRRQLNFGLRDGGYDVADHNGDSPAASKPRSAMQNAGWVHRRYRALAAKQRAELRRQQEQAAAAANPKVVDPFAKVGPTTSGEATAGADFDPAVEQHVGIVLGIGVCSYRMADGSDQFLNLPGDDVRVSFPMASLPPKVASQFFTVVDFYESKMADYDSSFAFVPLAALQKARGMVDPTTGVARFNTIQIKLKPGVDPEVVRDKLQDAFQSQLYLVSTWRDKEGSLLAAVQMETAILNILLFLIIAVAGFGILAIFFLIVVEKTRDIGILKSLGASAWGIMATFMAYGLSLGMVGAGAGTALGLLIVAKIQSIADFLSWLVGQPVFDPSIYYFYKIPTIVEPFTVSWIVIGSVLIAVMASILPAIRAARLHPVRALRFE